MNGKVTVGEIANLQRETGVLNKRTDFYAQITREINSSGTGQGKRELFTKSQMTELIAQASGDELAAVLVLLRRVQARLVRKTASDILDRYGVAVADLESGFAAEDRRPDDVKST